MDFFLVSFMILFSCTYTNTLHEFYNCDCAELETIDFALHACSASHATYTCRGSTEEAVRYCNNGTWGDLDFQCNDENEDIETTDAAKTINTPQTGLMKDRETKRTPVGAIVGPIVALLVGVVLVGLFLLFKRRKNRETDNGMNGMTNELYWGQSARPHQDTQPGIGIAELNRREDGTDEKRSFDNAEYFRTQEIMDNINVGNTDLKACDGDMEHRTVGNQYGTADNTNTSGFGSSDGKYFNNVYDNAKAHQC
ncbi:uncharacterized protein LOC128238953 isoform X2 [Mya arenaria]|uniref:uncharacterized protein LOC128238953 isoform X2 n=1 Tax=Mya arenaria TaxID=6604 RepID=UPI0022E0A073|nr:uncharacterized protein LOC128238953 isoform X2 [Mya arenaria]